MKMKCTTQQGCQRYACYINDILRNVTIAQYNAHMTSQLSAYQLTHGAHLAVSNKEREVLIC